MQLKNTKFRVYSPLTKEFTYASLEWLLCGPSTVRNQFLNNEETIGLFTGIHDRKGKEIYEGDILKHYSKSFFKICGYYPVAKVKWCNESASLVFVSGVSNRHFNTYRASAVEVIGNIYENPELLKD